MPTLKSLIEEQTGINEQGGIFRLLHEKLLAGWKENLKNLSEHALLLGTSEYVGKNKECQFISKYACATLRKILI